MQKKIYVCALFCLMGSGLQANLPVMNTLPRWNHGYGLQTSYEYQKKDRLYQRSELVGQEGAFEEIQILRLQGVVTFDKEYRLFFELPWERSSYFDQNQNQGDSSFGDLSLGGAIKKYYNLKGTAADIGVAPFIHWSVSPNDFYPTKWGTSLSLLGNIETYYFLFMSSLRSRIDFGETQDKFSWEENLFMSLGYHFFHNNQHNLGGWLSLGFESRYFYTSNNFRDNIFTYTGVLFDLAPIVMFYWHNYLLHIQVSLPIYRNSSKLALTESFRVRISFGGAFLY